jgi:DNA-binding CsgD family transcriptional regulator
VGKKGDINLKMARVSGRDYRDILNLIYLANRCVDIESLIHTLFLPLMQVFRAECATLQLIKGYPLYIKITESRSFRSDSHNICEDNYYPALYKDSYYHHSPLLNEASSSPKIVLKFGDSVSFRDWERSDFYNNFMLPQQLYWELFLTLRWRNNLEGMITLWRSKKQPDYEDRDVSKAEMLVPHLGVAVHNICLISQISKQGNCSLSADDASSEGLLWLDSEFTPSFFNTEARDICRQLSSGVPYNTSDLEKGEFTVPPYIIKDCSDLLTLLETEEQPILWPKERIVSAESGKKFRIECSLIWKADQISSTPNFMITLSGLSDEEKLETALQTRFNLSRRELDIIYCITRGLSDDEIGNKLYISRQTVHTHIKKIYKKLGVKNRVELYRIVMHCCCPGMPDH